VSQHLVILRAALFAGRRIYGVADSAGAVGEVLKSLRKLRAGSSLSLGMTRV
jgi:hypothetical protein